MATNLTDEEMAMFDAVKTQSEWHAGCAAVKEARNGAYPADWWPKMKLTGKMDEIFARFGGSTKITIEIPSGDAV